MCAHACTINVTVILFKRNKEYIYVIKTYLFVIGVEILSPAVKRNKDINGIPINNLK